MNIFLVKQAATTTTTTKKLQFKAASRQGSHQDNEGRFSRFHNSWSTPHFVTSTVETL